MRGVVAARTHLEEREFFVDERGAHGRVEKVEKGALRAHAYVEICARAYAWLRARDGGGGYGEVGRGVEIQEHVRGGYAVQRV